MGTYKNVTIVEFDPPRPGSNSTIFSAAAVEKMLTESECVQVVKIPFPASAKLNAHSRGALDADGKFHLVSLDINSEDINKLIVEDICNGEESITFSNT